MAQNNNRITILPPEVTEKIAAGEVVERPASVVKELVENALDAAATRIDIAVEDAGFSMIRVSDNGCGMSGEDLEKSVMRHATSKIRKASDLFCIATLGFRGEALASIGAVSRLGVKSSATDDGLGNEIACDGGVTRKMTPVEHTRGTTVVCRDLFYNVPARKKFMKTRRSERTALLRYIEQLVIPFPSVHFSLAMEGKRVLESPQVDTVKARIAQVAGAEFAKELIVCTSENNALSATIHISTPANATPRPRYQYLYVNLRRVDSDPVTFGIRESFARFITDQRRPSWFCFLELDPQRVDVNVHPTKQRVKFDDERAVFGFVYGAVQKAFPETLGEKNPAAPPLSIAPSGAVSGRITFPPVSHAGNKVMEGAAASYISSRGAKNESVQTALSFLSLAGAGAESEKELADSSAKLREQRWELIPCYQIHRLFILAPIKNGILLIDQHAAHERVLFEQALDDLKTQRAQSQRLLFPIVVELSLAEKSAVVSGRDYFNAFGFDLQDFGGQSVAVSSIPAAGFLKESGIEEAVREIVGYLLEEKDPKILSQPQFRYAAAFACGSAIKAGQELKQEEMNSLLNSLFATENPYICPHGRPTLVRISLDELRRRFLR
jgi:DNA mismatch repair protein MutL